MKLMQCESSCVAAVRGGLAQLLSFVPQHRSAFALMSYHSWLSRAIRGYSRNPRVVSCNALLDYRSPQLTARRHLLHLCNGGGQVWFVSVSTWCEPASKDVQSTLLCVIFSTAVSSTKDDREHACRTVCTDDTVRRNKQEFSERCECLTCACKVSPASFCSPRFLQFARYIDCRCVVSHNPKAYRTTPLCLPTPAGCRLLTSMRNYLHF